MAHFTREEFLCIFTPLPPKTADFRYFWVWFSCFSCTKHKPDALPTVLYFCIFVNAKRQGVQIYLIKSTNESFIDYYIYYRHAHLFSQKHKNAKYEHKGKFTWSMPIDEASKFLLHPLQAHCMEKITAWRGRKIFLATQKNKVFITKCTCSDNFLQNKQK